MKIATCIPVLCALAISSPIRGQVVVKSGTELSASPSTQIAVKDADVRNLSSRAEFKDIDLFLTGAQNIDLSTVGNATTPTPLHGVIVEGGGEYSLLGAWKISDLLTLTNGKLIVAGSGNEITYTGADDLVGSDASYIEGPLYMEGTGTRTFPIGSASGYFPVRLDNVEEGTAILGFAVIDSDPNISSLPNDVTDVLKDRYWQFFSRGSGFKGSRISVSANQLLTFLQSVPSGAPTLLEVKTDNSISDLGGKTLNDFLVADLKASPDGEIYAVGKKFELVPIIGEVLSPNSDSKNNVLIIANIEFFPENKVTLMDRYSAVLHTWTNFQNYSTSDAKQEFDFTSLAIGNYVCVVQYTTTDGQASVTQMITVLK